jgi:DNA-binding MarR family transcriptional regulator
VALEPEDGACRKADRIASAFASKYAWADSEALKLYYRLELVHDTLREVAAKANEASMPGGKGRSVAMLRALYLSPDGRLSHAEIGDQTRVPPANVTYHVDVLQQGGYVRRVPHGSDRRVTLVELTPEGRAICEQVIPARAHLITDLGAGFTEEEKILFNDFLLRLQQAIPSPAQVLSRSTDLAPAAGV